MKLGHKLVPTLLLGAVIGAAATQMLHAQSKPPAYVVVEISKVTDRALQKANAGRTTAAAAKVLQEFGGRYLARANKITVLDGSAPKRLIIIKFDSGKKAQDWYNSPTQKQVNEIRLKSTKSRAFIVEGM